MGERGRLGGGPSERLFKEGSRALFGGDVERDDAAPFGDLDSCEDT